MNRTTCSPGASSAGSVVASGELCRVPAAGTTSRRNRRWPRAWHPGPSGNPAGQRWKLEESELRAEGGARRTGKRKKEGRVSGETRDNPWKGWIDINPVCSIEDAILSFFFLVFFLPLLYSFDLSGFQDFQFPFVYTNFLANSPHIFEIFLMIRVNSLMYKNNARVSTNILYKILEKRECRIYNLPDTLLMLWILHLQILWILLIYNLTTRMRID